MLISYQTCFGCSRGHFERVLDQVLALGGHRARQTGDVLTCIIFVIIVIIGEGMIIAVIIYAI